MPRAVPCLPQNEYKLAVPKGAAKFFKYEKNRRFELY